jgi:hypothetical protein
VSTPGQPPPAGIPDHPTPPNDVPSAIDLLGAVEEFLLASVLPQASDEIRFYVRVSANILAVVQRELAGADERSATHREDLETIGARDENDLAAQLRAGRLNWQDPRVVDVVRRTVRAKLEVARPGFIGET